MNPAATFMTNPPPERKKPMVLPLGFDSKFLPGSPMVSACAPEPKLIP